MVESYQGVLLHGLGWRHSAPREEKLLHRKRERNPQREFTLLDVSRPTRLGQFVDAAAQVLYRNNAIGSVVVAGSKQFGHEEAFEDVLEHQFRLRAPNAPVRKAGEALTSRMEMEGLIGIAQDNNWTDVATVTLDDMHAKRVRKIAAKKERETGITITVLTAKDILSDPTMHEGASRGSDEMARRYSSFYERLTKSDEYRKWKRYELMLKPFVAVGLTPILDRIAIRRQSKNKKARPQAMSQ